MDNSDTSEEISIKQFSSKVRGTNFTNKEVNTLKNLVERYKNVIMCRGTDKISSKQKENAWVCITKDFNAVHCSNRTLKQLKYKFENMKKFAKSVHTKERQEMIKTGGGRPPFLPPDAEDANDWLTNIMSGSIKGNQAIYDDDIVTGIPHSATSEDQDEITTDIFITDHHKPRPSKKSKLHIICDKEEQSPPPSKRTKLDILFCDEEVLSPPPSKKTEPDILFCDENVHSPLPSTSTKHDIIFCDEEENITNKVFERKTKPTSSFDSSTPHSSLKKPMATPLKRQIRKVAAEDNMIKNSLRQKKINVIDELHDLELEKLRQNMKNSKELHDQEMRHRAELHELNVERSKLEIKVLKKKLNEG